MVIQTTIQMARLKYRVCAPTNTKPTIAKLYKENPDMPWEEVQRHLTPDAMLAERVMELKAYALKCTGRHRKLRLAQGCRRYPPFGLCAKEYVKQYYAINKLGIPTHFAPLAEHVSCPQGFDSYEEL